MSVNHQVSRYAPLMDVVDVSDNNRLLRLERKVDFLFRHLGIDADAALAADAEESLPTSFYEALARGKAIEAVKIYRDATGADLKTAKDAVDAMTGRRR
jgi:ribosomal protein L7/L12